MSPTTMTVNGETFSVDFSPTTPLLWVLRDTLGLTGTKYGCGEGLCGSCTVHLDGEAARSCITPVSATANINITTIEGLAVNGDHRLRHGLHRLVIQFRHR